ncbi:APC family permease [Synechococcus sp. Lug-A]|uniref:APC family permease n=1 Tax=Synechococcus sp. Lug-A TaxID=2823740 RepID=UPI0020CC299E|nr:APC family permease [Synechococcus sp. Lug-A]MCP9846984.1 APC family permease [Synechococcus sp. Lug-A]
MEPNPTARTPEPEPPPPAAAGGLLHILGLGFGLAGAVGGSMGAGILRTPGLVAAQLGSALLILLAWLVGGLYALCGAFAVAELGAALPRAGGWTIYARRALGDRAGFAVGWIDWLGHCAGLAWVAITIGEFARGLVPALPPGGKAVALFTLVGFALLQRLGLRAGSLSQQILSLLKAVAFLALIGACLLVAPPAASTSAPLLAPSDTPLALAAAGVFALQAVITTYDGWQSPIYFAEEFTAPATDLPRSLIGGVVAVTGVYLLVNVALLKVLPLEAMAASTLPLADAAARLFGPFSAQLITALALLSSIGLVNTVIMCAPRILFGLSRDGLFLPVFARVNAGGTPDAALLLTTAVTATLILCGDFQLLLGVSVFFYVLLYFTGITSLFLLRWREPELERPVRAWGYPLSAAVVWLGSLAFLISAAIGDSTNSLIAAGLIALSLPAQLLSRRMGSPDCGSG